MPDRRHDEFARRIVAEHHGLVAWDKPAGLPSTGRTLDDPQCAQAHAMTWAGRMVWAVHQLDRDTSGLLLFARKKSALLRAQQALAARDLQKIYVALVHGRPDNATLLIDAPLRKRSQQGRSVVDVHRSGKSAQTRIWHWASSPDGNYSLVAAELLTGRTHQLRAHLHHAGHPLLGETLYNDIPCALHPRQALHALGLINRGGHQALPETPLIATLAEDLVALAHDLHVPLPARDASGWAQAWHTLAT
ncbi:pseudouridine synthase family protein [Lujinxingia sediminis]|uniref:pseudouridine synthase family protein n=1 Tax=Lujinxingia sediminis TaxID=2480984 RepID=UPI0013E34A31|nr:RNA pseudouridine synthase [Lujinxingia sediminis]